MLEKQLSDMTVKKTNSNDKLKSKILELKIAANRFDKAEKDLKAKEKENTKLKKDNDEIALKKLNYAQQNLKIKLQTKNTELTKLVETKDKKLMSIQSEHQAKLKQIHTKHALQQAQKEQDANRKKQTAKENLHDAYTRINKCIFSGKSNTMPGEASQKRKARDEHATRSTK